MVFAEATTVLPLIASDAYHKVSGKTEIEKLLKYLVKNWIIYLTKKVFWELITAFQLSKK